MNAGQFSYDELPAILTIEDVCRYLALSHASVYRGLNKGDIPATRVGSTWIIGRDAFFDKFSLSNSGRAKTPLLKNRTIADRASPTAGAVGSAAPIPSPTGASAAANDEVSTIGPWRDTKYAAARLGCTPRSVCEMCQRGEIRYFKRGREYLFQDEYIDEYIASRSGRPTAQYGVTK